MMQFQQTQQEPQQQLTQGEEQGRRGRGQGRGRGRGRFGGRARRELPQVPESEQPKTVEGALEALKTVEWGKNVVQLMRPIPAAFAATHGKPAERAALEKKLVDALETADSRPARDYLVRQLMLMGTSICVPALAKLLLDPERSHMGRFALERIPAAEAGDALRTALDSAPNEQKIGIIASLGARGEEASVPVLAALLSGADDAIARAAALALGAMRTDAAASALSTAQASEHASAAVADASLACAENLIEEGKGSDALAIYKRFAGDDQPRHVKLAATRGMLAAAGGPQ